MAISRTSVSARAAALKPSPAARENGIASALGFVSTERIRLGQKSDVGLRKSWFPIKAAEVMPCVAMGICSSIAKLLQNTWTLGLVGHSHGGGLSYLFYPILCRQTWSGAAHIYPWVHESMEGFSRFLPLSLCQGRVAPILIKIRKANSLMLYQAASVGSDLLPAPGEICDIYLVLNLCLNICSFLFQMISDLMTGINSD